MSDATSETPKGLRAFAFHGVDFTSHSGDEAIAECFVCGKPKLYVNVETSQWQCKVCGNEGNALDFIRLLYDHSHARTSDVSPVAEAKGLLFPETPLHWGVTRSVISGDFLVPGYGADGTISQVYKYSFGTNITYPTPGLATTERVGMFGVGAFDSAKPTTYVCEGWPDGMAWSEILRVTKRTDEGGTTMTGAGKSSLFASANVVAVPGANVWPSSWCKLLAGQHVVFMYDNDHPGVNEKTGADIPPTGIVGTKRAASMLKWGESPPASLSYLKWGPDGYDLEWKNHGDIRDLLKEAGSTALERAKAVRMVLDKIEAIPDNWIEKNRARGAANLETLECNSWTAVASAWRKALRMRDDLFDVLATMLAVATSTEQKHDQLFLQVIGDAGSGKTRFCDAMLTSKHCHALEHLTGFHSGWKGDNGEDYSLIKRVNMKTMITPEGDVLMSSPNFHEIMSQQRRIFDGKSGATYKNRTEDLQYTNLRTPWIIAGTPALVNTDQTKLGDRFLRIYIAKPGADERREIMRRVGFATIRAVPISVNNGDETTLTPELEKAYRITGGYIDYLRANASRLLEEIERNLDPVTVEEFCCDLAEFVALMRARPDAGKVDKETMATIEMPTRLHAQFIRLSMCLAVVLGKKTVDETVLNKAKKVCLDTAQGRVLELVGAIYRAQGLGQGDDSKSLELSAVLPMGKATPLLKFLRDVHAAESYREPGKTATRWRLTERVYGLYERVMINGTDVG